MSALADDAHMFVFGVPSAEPEPHADSDDGSRVGSRARRIDVPAIGVRHPSPERRRYFLSSFEPSGEYDAVIVAVTDDGRRRYFTTRDGASLTEVDEVSFERRRESGTRSMLELDERELGELEVELQFVRPVRGRDPIAEAQDAAAEASDEFSEASADAPADASPSDAAVDAVADEQAESDPAPVRRSTFAPVDAADMEAALEEEYDEVDDPMTEEFEAMVMESTTMTSERVDVAASVLIDGPDAAPVRSATPMSAADAIAQVALAKGIAFVAHRGQHDRSGLPYVDHPGRIAERFDPLSEPIAAAAAWLHDVLEDTAVTAQELFEAGVLPDVLDVVQLLTRTPDVTPDEYYAAIRRDPVARRVKLADIDDNTARWRLRRLDYDTQLRLVEKYRHARQALGTE